MLKERVEKRRQRSRNPLKLFPNLLSWIQWLMLLILFSSLIKSGMKIWTLFNFNPKMLLTISLIQQRMRILPQVSLSYPKRPNRMMIRKRKLNRRRRRKRKSQRRRNRRLSLNNQKKRKKRRSLQRKRMRNP
jgi:hypothetical protein